MTPPYELDSHQQLVWDSEVSCVVLGSQSQPDRFLLVPLPMAESMTGVLAVVKQTRDYAYAGTLAFNAGESSAVCEPGMEATMVHAALLFGKLVAELSPDVLELERMYRLEDTRH
jgi:hypothetical protein